jgi:XTP/dITP diphosphohydrolase
VSTPIPVHFVTRSDFKVEENQILTSEGALADGSAIGDLFDFRIRREAIQETLEVDLELLVQAEVVDAYYRLGVPCIVEHAGLVFADHADLGYPGGLTKPMWNVLGPNFIAETRSAGRSAIARAVIAYCDGSSTYTFSGETDGRIADSIRGDRSFYWDTVFIPDEGDGRTYAEIVADETLGLRHKVLSLSQSTRAMLQFLEWRRTNQPRLWP